MAFQNLSRSIMKIIVVFHHQQSVVHRILVYDKESSYIKKLSFSFYSCLHSNFFVLLSVSLLNLYIFSFSFCFIQIFQQSDPCVCLPQEEQILVCTDPTSSQDCICSTSNSNFIQQTSFPQQQYICVDHTPSVTIQPTIINEIPVFNPISTNRSSQCFICLPQTSSQPLQIIQPQIVQTQPLIQSMN
jgi:hypothetical protein